MEGKYGLFIDWYGTPSKYRDPKTQKEFTAMTGISSRQIQKWKKDPRFRTDLLLRAEEWGNESAPDIVQVMYDKAMAGSVPAMALFFKTFPQFLREEPENKSDNFTKELINRLRKTKEQRPD